MKHPRKSIAAIQSMADFSPETFASIGEIVGGNPECVERVKSIDGRVFAMLSEEEKALLNFYRNHGRKFGVAVSIVNDPSAEAVAKASSGVQATQTMELGDGRVSVAVDLLRTNRGDE